MPKSRMWALSAALFLAVSLLNAAAADSLVYSGPQPGEKITSFKTMSIPGSPQSPERDPLTENKGRPIALIFVHNIERSLVPLLRVVDEYGAMRKDQLTTEVIFLAEDRIAGEQRIKAVANSLKLKSRVSLSLDGAEGPGNYGLNKECMMTIVAAKNDEVTANFALVQPGIADAPKVIEALAKVSGDANPPTVETLFQRTPGMAQRMTGQARRGEADMRMPSPTTAEEKFPGAVPTDEKLAGLLRQYIRKTNDDATVDKVLADVKQHISGSADLRKQAIDGWTRVLHFGDRYGTDYARETGAEFLAELKKQ